jgi:hypothetical protein
LHSLPVGVGTAFSCFFLAEKKIEEVAKRSSMIYKPDVEMKANYANLLLLFLFFALLSCGGNNPPQEISMNDLGEESAASNAPSSKEEIAHPAPPPSSEVMPVEPAKSGSTKEAITAIRTEYARLQKLLEEGTLRKDTKAFDCAGDPTEGELVRYYEEDQLVVIQHNQGSEHSWEIKQVYLKNAVPIFVLEEEGYWTFGGPLNKDESANTIDYVTENRYYFQEGELIRQLTKKYETHSWEKLPEGSEVPNKEVEVTPEQNYLGVLPYVADFKKGVVGC